MIVRKPYAFLIKYFKLIHIIFFIFMSYLAYKMHDVYEFFSNYAKTGTYTYMTNMTFKYVNILMVIIAIILVGVLLLIYFLMKQKEKKVLFYLLATIYYFLSFVLYIYFISIFSSLEFKIYNNQSLVLYRDISMVLYYLNYIFIVVSFIRGFGFNIKKFNFEKDLKELNISEKDREEIEVGGMVDYENVGDFLRRRKRNFGYYIKENSYILTIFLVITTLSLGSYIAIDKLVINKVFNIGEEININNFHYVINDCYIINKDIDGNIIKNNKSYAIVDFSIKNQNTKNITLDLSTTRLKVDDEYYYPKNNVGNKFNEFGTVYKKQLLTKNVDYNYILVYEIEDNYKKIFLELLSSDSVVNNEVIFKYKHVNIIPYDFQKQDLGEYKVNQEINLSKTYFKKGMFTIKNMEILDKVNYTYKKCLSESKCQEYEKEILASGNNKVLKVEYSLNINKSIFNYIKIDDKVAKNLTPGNYKENEALIEIPSDKTIENLVLTFDIRNAIFKVSS